MIAQEPTETISASGAKLWSYTLDARDGRHALNMPEGATIIGITEYAGEPTLIAYVDPKAELEDREFLVVTVGDDMPSITLGLIGTFTSIDGQLKVAFELV